MEVIIQPDSSSATAVAARLVSHLLREKPDAVLGLCTGTTSLLLYSELVRMYRAGYLDFSRVRTFNMDEFVGLPPEHPASCHSFMAQNFFRHVNVPKENIHIPDGVAEDIPGYCKTYERLIRDAGGIDLQVTAIGAEGHVGFNEPTSSLGSRIRSKTLTPRTRTDFAPVFGGERHVPKHVLTMGLGNLMESRQCILLAFGAAKANAIAQSVEGPVSSMMPASVLQMHPVCKVILDEGAASQLRNTSYYRWVYEGKPEWQQV